MAAIEALKSEKAEKEVRCIPGFQWHRTLTQLRSASSNNSRTRQEPLDIRNCVSAMSAVHTSRFLTPTVVSRTTSVAK